MRGVLTIDLSAVRANYALLQAQVGAGCVVAPAVKADAYGLGMAEVAPALWDAGARCFFVALPEEGVALWHLLPTAAIYILHGFSGKEAKEYAAHDLIPVLNSVVEIAAFRAHGGACALHFDTGMNRLGISADDVVDDAGLDVRLVMSHFASSDEKDSPFNAEQAGRFAAIAKRFPNVKNSLANSSGIFRDSAYHYDLVRPGYALYGGNPVPEQVNPMKTVVSLSAPVLQIHGVKKGETAGYNQTHVFEKDTKVAVVSIGYADGLPRGLSNKGAFYWKGYRLPIRGRVSMDLTICDLDGVPERLLPASGDMLEMIGSQQSVDAIAHDAGTNGYEILTSLRHRYRRIYSPQ